MDPISLQNSTTSNLLRISGLASGIDTDSIVKQLMTAASQPLYELEQQKQWLQWQQEDLQDINTKLLSLRDNTLFKMKLQGTYLAKTVSSNTSIATATAGVNAVNGTYILNVNQLATAATSASDSALNAYTTNSDGSITYNSLILAGTTCTINLNGKQITLGSSDKDWTINDIVSAINKANAGVNATYDTTTDRLFLITNSTGSNAKIDFSGTTDSNALNFLTNTLKLNTSTVTGTDASFSFNGVNITTSSNNVTVAGINVNLTGIGQTTLSVQTDTDTIYNSIKSFVDAYNDVITQINSKLTEERYYDYKPLTDAQKEQMKDSDITLWEQKARSGDLNGNSTLTSIYYNMRNAISGTVTASDGTKMTLSSIGITTGQWYEGGKLYIDDTKLKDAIQKNPQEVMDLFTKLTESPTDVNATPGSSQNDGIAARLYYIVNNGINSITQEAGGGQYQLYDNSFLGQQINDLNQRMSDMQDHLNTLEQQYYNQFTQLEIYMAQMNSQSQWLSQQLGG
ncbi:flagellar hook-associated 2 domain protein [Thermoanaerobacterium thermosaccharolyticum DSM 571]|uniref:Flagellar hook-associated protein 2 n=1 Tax=Thermoanaerobacterium thermosaccharolyticum (strain ATCC 7956 / DSM 571 / NCIMB 9385 / NCA 3814 / NCTC 13789 / WDCM 00135 / 2032) TaxID=580327 RepID=D9TRR8_THETC|nr:flagellar filament capping protein FliD [Thermoanaerobacterium thermosaccharolyticum]ADL69657.1 flagellar hook-associated 2 domain protein [Thermoanaerobacterium thermosaccharolyticum DSM 571]